MIKAYNFFRLYLGLPGSVGSIFVSRLSTALHAAEMTFLPSSIDHNPHPSPRLVMMTLLTVTLPIQVVFLCIVYAFGWLHLSIVFVVLEVLFFCITVSSSFPNLCGVSSRRLSDIRTSAGNHLTQPRSASDQLTVATQAGPRYVRATAPLGNHGPRRATSARRMLRSCSPPWLTGIQQTEPLAPLSRLDDVKCISLHLNGEHHNLSHLYCTPSHISIRFYFPLSVALLSRELTAALQASWAMFVSVVCLKPGDP